MNRASGTVSSGQCIMNGIWWTGMVDRIGGQGLVDGVWWMGSGGWGLVDGIWWVGSGRWGLVDGCLVGGHPAGLNSR